MANHTELKKFAQSARRQLREQVAARLEQVLRTDSAELREHEAARKELVSQIAETSKAAVIDRVAYTWFNRFCALRFMDVNRYNRIAVVSPADGATQPEILQEAKQGYIEEDLRKCVDGQMVFDLLDGRRPSSDPQQEAYRLLLVGACNALNPAMPFLFETIADYTELLMPQDLLSEQSILHALREAMTPEACQDVEVIGWLYQFYISERKDEVFDWLKKGKKVEAEDIPAATQLFTPHWIVRYLVENSLGRLWLLNRSNSRLAEKMDYYIRPEEPETDFLRVATPEEIKVCDPACGSGHMLTYAFDLLHAIYEEEGYPANDIPRLILEKNLYGIEIDERAGDLAAFALTMKARGRDRRFLTRGVKPNICVLENATFTDQELKEYSAAMGRDLFSEPLLQTLRQFEQAKNFGSLIRPALTDTTFVRAELERKGMGGNLFMYGVHERVLRVLKQTEYLCPHYHVVLANPPYMGGGSFNEYLSECAINDYPESKADLFAMFIERNQELCLRHGFIAMITMQSWMFLSSFEILRLRVIINATIVTMAHLGSRAFDTIGGDVVSTTAFVLCNNSNSSYSGIYVRLIERNSEHEKELALINAVNDPSYELVFKESSTDFRKIPGAPIAYWVSQKLRHVFSMSGTIENRAVKGLDTGGNIDLFLKRWFEISVNNFSKVNKYSDYWYPIAKGGKYRKWFGNHDYVINYSDSGMALKKNKANLRNKEKYFNRGITWTVVSSGNFAARFLEPGFLFDQGGSAIFTHPNDKYSLEELLGFLNSKITQQISQVICPTMNFTVGDVRKFPVASNETVKNNAKRCIEIAKADWDSSELSWDFACSPLLGNSLYRNSSIFAVYQGVKKVWGESIKLIKHLEEESNSILIDTMNLTGELSPDVPIGELTLNYNPTYRYGEKYSPHELESQQLADTMREFISYAVGCMFGRYSLDKPGLILANQGDTLQDYLRQVPDPSFLPDADNAIPVLIAPWFSDDISERFKKFLRVTFGDDHYEENLAFIEQAIGRDIRSYFVKEFYSQHVKMYQKRPIYWMFSSPKGSFNVLIYMHRYQPDTISVILNRYLREFLGKLEGRKSHLQQVTVSAGASPREKTAALKEIEKLNRTLEEVRDYERDVLYPLAVQRVEIDLDDGVKVNYAKLGKALAKIPGLTD